MSFPTQFDKHTRVITNSGNPIINEYVADESGNPVFKGHKNLDLEIQSHRESVELSVLMQRYESGDLTALNKVDGVYTDASDMPTSFSEAYNRIKQAEDDFDHLPSELKKLFNNDVKEFYEGFGTKDFNDKIIKYRSSRKSNKKGSGNNSADPSLFNSQSNGSNLGGNNE